MLSQFITVANILIRQWDVKTLTTTTTTVYCSLITVGKFRLRCRNLLEYTHSLIDAKKLLQELQLLLQLLLQYAEE